MASGNFFPTILQALGYDSLITLCLTAPPYSQLPASSTDVRLMSTSLRVLHLRWHLLVVGRE